MKREDIFTTLNMIFQDIFDDDSIIVNENTTSKDIEDWDSLEHINLVVAIEKRFKLHFTIGEVSSMKNVGAMVDVIMERGSYE